MIVADIDPIIAFARLGQLDLLRQAVESLVIPDAVYEELVGRGHGDRKYKAPLHVYTPAAASPRAWRCR